MSELPTARRGVDVTWRSFEGWIGTRGSALALFVVAAVAFAAQSVVLPVGPGRDMARYVQAFLQLGYDHPVLVSVADTRGPLAALGVGIPLELGGTAAEVWLGLLYAASIVGWSALAMSFGPRAALFTAGFLLLNPSYAILFHGLASDALFAAAFVGWVLLLTRAIRHPTVVTFGVAGLAMGGLVLVRPANQLLIVMALLPLALRAPWGDRARWAAAFFVASTVVSQGWKATMAVRYGDETGLRPSGAFLVVALVLLVLLVPAPWKRWLALASVPLLVLGLILRGGVDPVTDARSVAQSPPASVFFFRAFELERIVSPDNGPESRRLADVVERELLPYEPYRSYGVTLEDVFSSGSDRIFGDVTGVSGDIDRSRVTTEAIRAHPRVFATGIARTTWALLRARAIATTAAPDDTDSQSDDGTGSGVVVKGRRLPTPSEGQPIPASRIGPVINTLYGEAREVWSSATEHSFVYDDPRDEQRVRAFDEDTNRLAARIPTRDGDASLVRRLDRAARLFPPPIVWLAVGVAALAIRRPRRAMLAIAPTVAALVVIVGTALVAPPVAEYALPVSPAFILLAAAGMLGVEPRGMLLRGRRRS